MNRIPGSYKREDVLAVQNRNTGRVHYAPKANDGSFYNRTLCGAMHGLAAMHSLVAVDATNRVTCRRCRKVLAHNEKVLSNMANEKDTITEDECELGQLSFGPKLGGKNKTVNVLLQKEGVAIEDIISITFYKNGPYEQYTVWYRKYKNKNTITITDLHRQLTELARGINELERLSRY